MQSLSEYTKLCAVNDMLRSFDLENNHENLEEKEDNPFDYFLQSIAWLLHHVNLCLAEIWSTILLSERIGIKYKKIKQGIINKFNQKENKSRILYEYKVGDQVLLETPGILRKLSTPCTGPYPVTNVYKIGTIRIQKGKKELYQKDWISVESLHSIKTQLSIILMANDIPWNMNKKDNTWLN
jgi:hypothetical protein